MMLNSHEGENELKDAAARTIDSLARDLNEISSEIWQNPEEKFEEFKAHSLLSTHLEQEGFIVERSCPLETSFIAKYGSASGPRIGFICEYDALPGIGHACGHNLIAETGVAAGVALKRVLQQYPDVDGQVTVFGTPAEEGAAGKILMMEKGSFDDVDVCMMVHPYTADVVDPICLSIEEMHITYHGKASPTVTTPLDGIVNSLDAAMLCYTAISSMRQQFRPSWKAHGIIAQGGVAPNVIPEMSRLHYYMRASNDCELDLLKEKMTNCIKSAAEATGCTYEITRKAHRRSNLLTNHTLAMLFKANAASLGTDYTALSELSSLQGLQTFSASTDMGSVSHFRPSIHPVYSIPTAGTNHTREFAKAADKDSAQHPTLVAAKALAFTAIDLLQNTVHLHKAQEEFSKAKTMTSKQ